MTYEQKTGIIKSNDGQFIGVGYAGYGEGKNNSLMQDIKRIGPLPKGRYWKGQVVDSKKTGPFSIVLIPDKNNEMFGRSNFMMHGDSKKNPGTASNGCIIASRKIREWFFISNEDYIDVI